jgi:hypothetical protein
MASVPEGAPRAEVCDVPARKLKYASPPARSMALKGPLLVVLLLLAAGLAGCLQDDLGPDGTPGDGTGAGHPGEGQALKSVPLSFTETGSVHRSISEQGSYSHADFCYQLVCLLNNFLGNIDHHESVDISEHVPVGVPTLVRAKFLHSNPGAMYNLSVAAEDGGVLWATHTIAETEREVEALVLRAQGENVRVYVIPIVPALSPEMQEDWTLEIDVEANTRMVPNSGAFRITVDAGTTQLNITTLDGGEATLLLFDVDDALL